MTAHNPITASKAIAMIEAIGVSDARKLLADHAAAGLVKSYAMVIETAEVGKPRRSVRGATVPVELLRRVVMRTLPATSGVAEPFASPPAALSEARPR